MTIKNRRMANFKKTPHRGGSTIKQDVPGRIDPVEYAKAQRFFAESGVNLAIVPGFDPVLLLEPENEYNKDYHEQLKRLGVI
ncbi:hypothetical protein CJP16_10570 [Aeromonas sobria]|uniref:Uncharacterized protein n=1 Tax=Aeromonas sobria TaxID=646 RepID=A0A2N3IZC0_AERSO|nr:hypothetical protein [Aeromonas sobria]PKQ78365.1 hypothetical protein CJP16_10570 [Aeromonas sobria]